MIKKEMKKQQAANQEPMGVYRVKCIANGKVFIDGGPNINGKVNSCRHQLIHGSHINRGLQQDYNSFGPGHFEIKIIDYLDHKRNNKTDYSDELNALKGLWIEKLHAYEPKGYHRKPV
jgi:hypothetical protein